MIFQEKQEGQGTAEYAWLLSLVALVLIVLLSVMGQEIVTFYTWILNSLPF